MLFAPVRDARVRDLIVAETRGNPLALLELPRGLTPAKLAGPRPPRVARDGLSNPEIGARLVLNPQTGQPAGIITEADIAHAVADGKDVNSTRIYELINARPTVITTTTSVRDAARLMTRGHFRHLPVIGDAGLAGIIDVCRALLETDVSPLPA